MVAVCPAAKLSEMPKEQVDLSNAKTAVWIEKQKNGGGPSTPTQGGKGGGKGPRKVCRPTERQWLHLQLMLLLTLHQQLMLMLTLRATCFAHCALRSKLHYHLPRLAAAWGSGITGSGLSSPFPLLRSTQSRSDRAENFEANTYPYRIPPLLSLHIHSPSHSTSTGGVSFDTTIRL